jgi:hypothetical protein
MARFRSALLPRLGGLKTTWLAVICVLVPCTAAITAVAATRSTSSKSKTVGAVTVRFGKPTKLQRLEYTQLYEKKPFPDAVLLYYDNGMYAILSEGEHHYGTYVMQGNFTEPTYTVNFISLPSQDWSGISVLHTLVFGAATATFTQQLINPQDPNVPKQTGSFTTVDNPVNDPTQLTWDSAQKLGR